MSPDSSIDSFIVEKIECEVSDTEDGIGRVTDGYRR